MADVTFVHNFCKLRSTSKDFSKKKKKKGQVFATFTKYIKCVGVIDQGGPLLAYSLARSSFNPRVPDGFISWQV